MLFFKKKKKEEKKTIKISELELLNELNQKCSILSKHHIDDEKGHRIRTISYQRNCVANMLHKAPIFNFFKNANGKLVNKLQCEDYCNKLEQVVFLLEKISKIY